MRRASVVTLVAFANLCLLTGAVLGRLPGVRQARPAGHATIEPTLPLSIDLDLTSVEGGDRGGAARLEVSVEAGSDIPDLTLTLRLPEGLRRDGLFPGRGASIALRAGERRRFVVPLSASRPGVFPIRIEAAYRLADGREIRAGQGVTLRLGARVPEGRSNAGAYEFMGVPLEDLRR